MVPLATGSDGGGSLRIPSSCCGLSAMKPSLGRVPSGGAHPPDWQNLSTKGPMARRLADVVAALDVVVGPDPSDLRSLPRPEASWLAALDDPRPPRKVAWSPTLGYAEVDAEVLAICERAVEVLASLGTEVVEVEHGLRRRPGRPMATLSGVYNLRTHAGLRGTAAWDRVDPVLAMVIERAAPRARSTWSWPRMPATTSTSGWSSCSTMSGCCSPRPWRPTTPRSLEVRG